MRHKIFIAFLSLLSATSTLDMAKAQSLPYKNKNLPIEERVEDLLNRMKTSIPPVTEETPAFRNIHISNIVCRGSGRAMFFNGLPEMPIRNVHIKDVTVSRAEKGIEISQAENVTIENTVVESEGNVLQVKNSKHVTVNGKTYQ